MAQLDKSSANQTSPASAESTEWDTNPTLPMRLLQSNNLEESDGWPPFFDPTAAWSGVNPDMMGKVGDFNYNQGLNGLDLNPFMVAPMHPSAMSGVGNYDPGFMASMHPNVAGEADRTSATNQASSVLGIDANGGSSSFDQAESTTQPTPNTPSGNNTWTKQEDKFLMGLKAQGLSYSAIQDEMRKEFGWTRNKNVLVKRFAVLKKRCKPQIKTRIVRDISKRITPEIIKAVGKELEKVTSSDSNNIAAELEDLVPLKLPEFLENLAADVCVSLSQVVDDDDHDLNA
ncbi:hypothetical protein F53441_11739 [Fusarium austroafricanum]|uniref:Myb-like domain-containing protein n=1 Tax=Fusarium austroafricanum TaxID=2364996 RepID=A0A8H4K424_9HYPO|nr:hypothetical protein F53441_11739 [Fusarium austroafricanum]